MKYWCLGLVIAGMLASLGCTSYAEYGKDKVGIVRVAEERSPFGTNVAFGVLQVCDKVQEQKKNAGDARSNPTPETKYVNCADQTTWTPFSSQGQGGQIAAGLLNAGGLIGLGALIPANNTTNNVSASSSASASSKSSAHSHGGIGGPPGCGHNNEHGC
jgi:hypothetical protein